MKKYFILLAIGFVLNVLFVFNSADCYEAIYYEKAFSNKMYNFGIYPYVASFAGLFTVFILFAYYYIADSVSFSRWFHWLALMIFTMAFIGILTYAFIIHFQKEIEQSFPMQSVLFSLVQMGVVALLFVIDSFSMRWWSINCRHTPIPE
ncbi:MAG: hypothetical protein IJ196_07120 [Prevotella sp.]|nr:hypothetical protein [Prevotella sp.]